MIYNVPFFANRKDNTHCVQATLKMVLKYFLPKRDFNWRELDRLSKYKKGLGTWYIPALIKFVEMGFKIINIEFFDYKKFLREGDEYIRKFDSPEVADWYLKHSNLKYIKKDIPKFLKLVHTQKQFAKIGDIVNLLNKGYLIASDINGNVLDGKNEYEGHAVLIIGYDKNNFFLHDPGLPPRPNFKVSRKLFRKAWSRKYGSGPNLTAFLYRRRIEK